MARSARREMTTRERLLRMVSNEPVDRGIFWPDGFWAATRTRWLSEGMSPDHDFGFDFDNEGRLGDLGLNLGYYPPFQQEVIEDHGSHQLIRDQWGIIKQVNQGQSMQFLEFPVHDRSSWEEIKARLDPDIPARYPEDLAKRGDAVRREGYPSTFEAGHLSGFFSFLRELCGDRVYYWLYDDPDLIREMLDFQVHRLTTFVRRITRETQVDRQFIWEDMCYKAGPLVGPDTFREFLLEPYQRTIEVAKERGVRIFDVDSDGNVEALLPLWLEAGVNMNHPCEVAAGVDVVALKRTYGEKLVLHGGIDKRAVAAGRDAIDREMERIRPAYELGGYIPHVDHSVPPDVSWDSHQYYLDKRRRLVGKA